MEEDAGSESEQREESKPAAWPPPPQRDAERSPAPWPPRPRAETDAPGRAPWERAEPAREPKAEPKPERAPWESSTSERAPWDRASQRPEHAPWDRASQRPEHAPQDAKQQDDDRTMAWQPARGSTDVPVRGHTSGAQAQTQRTQARAAQPVEQRGTVAVRRLRRGRLAIRKIDPWAVFKFSLVFYFCMLLITMFTVAIIFAVMQIFGVIGNIEKFLRDLDLTVTITGMFLFRWLFLLGLAGTLIASAVTMFMAFLYNLIADVVGGIELLVTERE